MAVSKEGYFSKKYWCYSTFVSWNFSFGFSNRKWRKFGTWVKHND